MFPIELSDFKALGLDTRAPWHLEVRDDLDASAMGAIHLLVNRAFESVVRAVANAENPSEEQSRTLSAMYCDVGRTLLDFALSRDDLDTDAEYEEETLGAALTGVIASAFPGHQAGALRRVKAADVTRWASGANAAFGLFSER